MRGVYHNVDINISDTYNEKLNYDKNGNILNLQRNGGFENPTTTNYKNR